MDRANYFFVKILQKTKLLPRFNFHLIKTINSIRVKIPFINGSGLTNFVINKDWLDSLIIEFVAESSDTFIDVGVNIGQTLLRLKTLKPSNKYLGFEPNSTCTSYTQQLVKLNRFTNCTIQNCALSNKVQTLVLEKTLDDDSRASVISSLRPGYFSEKEFVLALDYDSFYLDRKISFVKIDVEGGELEVLQGMKQSIIRHKPLIVCEVLDSHDESVFEFTQERATQLSDFLYTIDYKIIQLETSRALNKLVSFKTIETINLKQWTPKSYDLNDYLFYPSNKEHEILNELQNII